MGGSTALARAGVSGGLDIWDPGSVFNSYPKGNRQRVLQHKHSGLYPAAGRGPGGAFPTAGSTAEGLFWGAQEQGGAGGSPTAQHPSALCQHLAGAARVTPGTTAGGESVRAQKSLIRQENPRF